MIFKANSIREKFASDFVFFSSYPAKSIQRKNKKVSYSQQIEIFSLQYTANGRYGGDWGGREIG